MVPCFKIYWPREISDKWGPLILPDYRDPWVLFQCQARRESVFLTQAGCSGRDLLVQRTLGVQVSVLGAAFVLILLRSYSISCLPGIYKEWNGKVKILFHKIKPLEPPGMLPCFQLSGWMTLKQVHSKHSSFPVLLQMFLQHRSDFLVACPQGSQNSIHIREVKKKISRGTFPEIFRTQSFR